MITREKPMRYLPSVRKDGDGFYERKDGQDTEIEEDNEDADVIDPVPVTGHFGGHQLMGPSNVKFFWLLSFRVAQCHHKVYRTFPQLDSLGI